MKSVKTYLNNQRRPLNILQKIAKPITITSVLSLFLFFSVTLISPKTLIFLHSTDRTSSSTSDFIESKLRPSPPATVPPPPRFAYLISGSAGDGDSLKRTLQVLYHPGNLYVIHLDLKAPENERSNLIDFVEKHEVFRNVKNVWVVKKANMVTYRGPTMVANTLHGAAILLKEGDLLHTFSFLPRDLNFIDHTSKIGWKEFQRARPIIVDPGLYSTAKSDVFWVRQRRSVPTAFKLFTGSAWVVLSRSFIEYCIWGWDNLPRMALMYYANFLSSPEGYFHTVICNAQEFRNTTVNSDLHFIAWDNPPKQHPHYLNESDMSRMIDSNAPFARKFHRSDPVLDKIDSQLLSRRPGMLVPGGWCAGSGKNGTDPCSVVGDSKVLKPGLGAKRLEHLIVELLSGDNFRPRQCK
ncbi:Glycosyl transferase, family 14 [Dillenia turbinata]|uniref:Glycosyl transferase, family 14 n=1 Tax=Dillenia turbinata TaxID=194707 RepID=A0AAN8VK36_9MAGN